jgi:hypothetical protein
MAKDPPNRRRRRSKDDICCDVAFVLASPLTEGTKVAVLNDALWKWSEFDGKIDGCRWWSEAACAIRENRKQLIHEHLVPRKVLIERLLGLEEPAAEKVAQVLQQCVGVVITKDEDRLLNKHGLRSKMPKDCSEEDQWGRYNFANIAVRELSQCLPKKGGGGKLRNTD